LSYKLRISDVRKSFNDFVALEPTSLDVRDGEFVTLLGPSGSGKTTLLMMVAGLLKPDGGDISIDGAIVTYNPPYERDIGMVFQNYALFPHLTVYDNIAFPLRMRRVAESEVRKEVMRVLEIVQLPHVAGRFPRQLSGGQQQRIALARCIVYKPSIILMDEPLGALDKKLRDQLQIEIKHLHRQLGTTILYVSHDQQETLTMSDRVCLMNHGKIVQLGDPETLYFYPESLFAADFLGESNLLDAEVTAQAGNLLTMRSPSLGNIEFRAAQRNIAGQPGHVMIRPERLFFKRSDVASDNVVPGKVEDVIFTGGVTKYFITVSGGGRLFMTAPTGQDRRIADIGDEVQVTWSPESTIVLPADRKAA
jgi:putative spermidine/putrescine transport system ATP-binding protein